MTHNVIFRNQLIKHFIAVTLKSGRVCGAFKKVVGSNLRYSDSSLFSVFTFLCNLLSSLTSIFWVFFCQRLTNHSCRPNPACHLFVYSLPGKNGFKIFKWLVENQEKKIILWHLKIMWKSNYSVLPKLFSEYSHVLGLCNVCGCFHMAELSMWSRPGGPQNVKYVLENYMESFMDSCPMPLGVSIVLSDWQHSIPSCW